MKEAPASIEAEGKQDAAEPARWLVPKLVLFAIAFTCAFGIDLASKTWISTHLPVEGPPRTVIDGFFHLTHARNAGTAFGFLEDWPVELRRVGFSILAGLAGWVVVLFYRGLAPRDRVHAVALGLIVGGGLGNLVDRLGRGEVIDFLRFELWGSWSFPDFNFADVFILTGVGILMTELLVSEGVARADVIEGRAPAVPRVARDGEAERTASPSREGREGPQTRSSTSERPNGSGPDSSE